MTDHVERAADDMRRQVVGAIAQAMHDRVNHEELDDRVAALEAWVRRLLWLRVLMFIGGLFLAVYLAVNAHQVFINACVQRAILSPARATICDKVFFGDSDFYPGLQVSVKPAPAAPTRGVEGE